MSGSTGAEEDKEESENGWHLWVHTRRDLNFCVRCAPLQRKTVFRVKCMAAGRQPIIGRLITGQTHLDEATLPVHAWRNHSTVTSGRNHSSTSLWQTRPGTRLALHILRTARCAVSTLLCTPIYVVIHICWAVKYYLFHLKGKHEQQRECTYCVNDSVLRTDCSVTFLPQSKWSWSVTLRPFSSFVPFLLNVLRC